MSEISRLFSRHGEVDTLELDDEFQEHLAARGTYPKYAVSLSEVLQVHANLPKYYLNATGRRAPVPDVGAFFLRPPSLRAD